VIDLGIYLLEHVDLASLVVVLGLVLDYVATQPLKSEALAWVRAGRFAVSLKHFLTGFLRGFIYRLFGKRLFSVRFFLKSSLISLVLLIIVVVLQAGYQRRPISQFTGIGHQRRFGGSLYSVDRQFFHRLYLERSNDNIFENGSSHRSNC
jgi:hypothetical protein